MGSVWRGMRSMSSDVGDGVILMAPWTWGGTSFSAMTSPMKTRVVEKVDLTSSKVRVSSRMSSYRQIRASPHRVWTASRSRKRRTSRSEARSN